MKRALISACLSFGLIFGVATDAMAQGSGSKQPLRRYVGADHAGLPYEVHITPTTMKPDSTSIETGGDSWSARGFDLKTLLAQVYDIDVRRIDFPNRGAADARYDVALALPVEVSPEVMQQTLQDALESKFKLAIKPESRTMDVYVMSAPNGPGAVMHRHSFAAEAAGLKSLVAQDSAEGAESGDGLGRITFMGKDCTGGPSSGGISVSAGTMSDFRRTLEPDLDRVLLDETHLEGSYDFQIGTYGSQDQLFKLLHEQLGIVVTPARRDVTVLTVRSADDLQAQL